MGKINSRAKGIRYEQALVRELKELLKTENIYTSRNESKRMDDMLVDIVGEVPVHIQAKALEVHPKSHDILKAMPKDKMPCIFWKKNHKEELVIMTKKDFYQILLTMKEK